MFRGGLLAILPASEFDRGPAADEEREPMALRLPLQPSPQSAWASGGLHVGVIMDGNGRWARARGLPRTRDTVAGPTPCDARWKRRPGSA